MNSEALAAEVEATIRFCQEGILGVGRQQYAEGEDQKFERMAIEDLFQYAREEMRDLINYAVMLDIRFRRTQNAISQQSLESGDSTRASIVQFLKRTGDEGLDTAEKMDSTSPQSADVMRARSVAYLLAAQLIDEKHDLTN